jgi:ABC-type enterochelin transport system substrate-binding protein
MITDLDLEPFGFKPATHQITYLAAQSVIVKHYATGNMFGATHEAISARKPDLMVWKMYARSKAGSQLEGTYPTLEQALKDAKTVMDEPAPQSPIASMVATIWPSILEASHAPDINK